MKGVPGGGMGGGVGGGGGFSTLNNLNVQKRIVFFCPILSKSNISVHRV